MSEVVTVTVTVSFDVAVGPYATEYHVRHDPDYVYADARLWVRETASQWAEGIAKRSYGAIDAWDVDLIERIPA